MSATRRREGHRCLDIETCLLQIIVDFIEKLVSDVDCVTQSREDSFQASKLCGINYAFTGNDESPKCRDQFVMLWRNSEIRIEASDVFPKLDGRQFKVELV